MRTLYLLLTIYTGLFLSACSTIDNNDSVIKEQKQPLTQAANQPKNPLAITVYTQKQSVTTPYIILGKAVISKYNLRGIKRQEACIHDTLRNLAAKMGGDAIIDLNKNDKTVTGTVIAYQVSGKQNDSSA